MLLRTMASSASSFAPPRARGPEIARDLRAKLGHFGSRPDDVGQEKVAVRAPRAHRERARRVRGLCRLAGDELREEA